MMEETTISVVIPMYNAEKTIVQTLDSIRRQTKLSNIQEILVIDDGSQDASKQIVMEYKNKYPMLPIRYIYQSNSGVSSARNRGLREAKGEFIAFLDSDDMWLETKIERQLQIFMEHPEIVFLGTAHKEKPLRRFGKKIDSLYKAKLEDVLWSYFPVTPSVMFRSCALNVVGYFDEEMSYCEDINYYLRFLIKFNYYYLPERLVKIDCGKKYMREKGLTSNMRMMHRGEMKNLKDVYKGGNLSFFKYLAFVIFTEMKYVRRIVITLTEKIRNRR